MHMINGWTDDQVRYGGLYYVRLLASQLHDGGRTAGELGEKPQ